MEAQAEISFARDDDLRAFLVSNAGLAPERVTQRAEMRATWIETPIGPLIAVSSEAGLHLLEFPERRALPGELKRLLGATGTLTIGRSDVADSVAYALDLYFAGTDPALDLPLAPQGTAFEHVHWTALREIPAGQTRTYAAIAETLGKPNAFRAVGRANGANPIAIVIPCHRLVAQDGALTGYGGGLWRKRWLLDHEAKHYGGFS